MIFRLRYRTLGGHTHVRVFAGKNTFALGKAGDLTFRNEEWEELAKLLDSAGSPTSTSLIEVLPEDDVEGYRGG